MKYSVLGFNQEKVMQTDLDMTDLMILNYILTACGSPTMKHKITESGEPLVWISHAKLSEDLPILRLTEGSLRNRLTKLKQNGYLQSSTFANENCKGTRSYYGLTMLTMSLIYDMENTMSLENDMQTPITSSKNDMQDLPCHSKITSNNTLDDNNKLKEDTIISTFVENYSKTCISYPKIRALTDKRKKAILKLFKKYSEEEILLVLEKAEQSDFLSGRTKDWRADLDWILNENNFIKILEGKYDNRRAEHNKKFAEYGVTSTPVTQEEIDNGYFTGEVL